MATPPIGPAQQANKVVVAFVDGRRLKGYIYDFSATKDFFNLLPAVKTLHEQGTKVLVKDLKAVFFVKDFQGSRDYQEKTVLDERAHGRKIEVSFRDGETILGKTEAYNPQKPGFFMFPGDAASNNSRIFVVTRNVQTVRFV
jgi:small nuclear ribonucleoprotein (snRNP)-like protein